MAETSSIEWTDATFNPWIGCTKVSPGCDHCYAETLMDTRWKKVQWGAGQPRVRTSPKNWQQPVTWNAAASTFAADHGRRRRVFCASLADVFDNEVPDAWRADLFTLIAATPDLDWLLLTKRIGNVARMLPADGLPRNVWMGISVVNQEEADRDIVKLDKVDAAVRWLSMEPLLGPVHLTFEALWGTSSCNGIDWVVVGGESGAGARPMHPDWVLSIRQQCQEAGVPMLFKQWGEWMPAERSADSITVTTPADAPGPLHPEFHDWPGGAISARVGKRSAGRTLEGALHDGYPE